METVNDRSPASVEREIAAQVAYEVAKSLYFEEQLYGGPVETLREHSLIWKTKNRA